MWALVESNSITRIYTRPTAITVGDVNYPANIMSMWTASELEAIGIYEVVDDNSNLRDGKSLKLDFPSNLLYSSNIISDPLSLLG